MPLLHPDLPAAVFLFLQQASLWTTDNVFVMMVCHFPAAHLHDNHGRFLCEDDVMLFFLCLHPDGIGINPAQTAGEADLLVYFSRVLLQEAERLCFHSIFIPFRGVTSSERVIWQSPLKKWVCGCFYN